METENQTPQSQTTYVVVNQTKSLGVALILTFLFGPLGLLYATVKGGIIMFLLSLFVALFTLGMGLLISWPVCMIWAAVAVNGHNSQKQSIS